MGDSSALLVGSEAVLIVDDEAAIRTLTARFLRAKGYAVAVAATGVEAEALVAAGLVPRLLLTDVTMPTMDGRQVFESLRARLPDLRVLFVSGYPADVIAQRGVLESDPPFLQKPFTRDDLLRKVRAVLDG